MNDIGKQIHLGSIPDGWSNYTIASELHSAFPLSFRKAQDVLIAIKKMRSGRGWFSSENARLRQATLEIQMLARALRRDDFFDLPFILDVAGASGRNLSESEAIFVFMNFFAQAFPNWRPEYEELNRLVPQVV